LADKKRRRPGAGRKPLDPQEDSIPVAARLTKDEWEAISRVASKHNRTLSREIREAVKYWNRILERPAQHIGALTYLITLLVKRIEQHTGRKWIEDPTTGAFVREEVGFLIEALAPAIKERPVIPPEVRQITLDLVETVCLLHREPELQAAFVGEDWTALLMLAKDLGGALLRNIGARGTAAVTISEEPVKSSKRRQK
jgi:hypothetical protein